MPRLGTKELLNIEIPLPPMDLQRKIVLVLEKISVLITLRKRQLTKLDELIKSRFVELFGNYQCNVVLSDVATVSGGLTKNAKRKAYGLQLPYLRVANVSFAQVDVSEMMEIGLTEEEKEKTLLQHGDLLFVEGNGSPDQIGRVAVWKNEVVPCVHQNHLIKARLNWNKALPEYVMFYFMTDEGRNQIKSKAVSTSGLYTLSVSKIAGFQLPLPPIEQQTQFAAFVVQVDKLKFSIQKNLSQLETLKKALMQQYFG